MKCSLGIFNFLEEISSLSHSIVFFYLVALITEEGFLICLAILGNSAFRWIYLSFSPIPFPADLSDPGIELEYPALQADSLPTELSGKRKDIHLNAEFQRIARRDKKPFLSDLYKEIEENNRMRKTRDLFKKIKDTKGTFHERWAQ